MPSVSLPPGTYAHVTKIIRPWQPSAPDEYHATVTNAALSQIPPDAPLFSFAEYIVIGTGYGFDAFTALSQAVDEYHRLQS